MFSNVCELVMSSGESSSDDESRVNAQESGSEDDSIVDQYQPNAVTSSDDNDEQIQKKGKILIF